MSIEINLDELGRLKQRLNTDTYLSTDTRDAVAAIEQLQAEVKGLRDIEKILMVKFESSQAEVERLRKDAERYQWLRDRFDACAADLRYSPANDGSIDPFLQVEQGLDQGAALDAAIDAALSQKG